MHDLNLLVGDVAVKVSDVSIEIPRFLTLEVDRLLRGKLIIPSFDSKIFGRLVSSGNDDQVSELREVDDVESGSEVGGDGLSDFLCNIVEQGSKPVIAASKLIERIVDTGLDCDPSGAELRFLPIDDVVDHSTESLEATRFDRFEEVVDDFDPSSIREAQNRVSNADRAIEELPDRCPIAESSSTTLQRFERLGDVLDGAEMSLNRFGYLQVFSSSKTFDGVVARSDDSEIERRSEEPELHQSTTERSSSDVHDSE